MRIWTAHLHHDAAPVLIPERFAAGAAVAGPLWLLAHRAWIPAILAAAASILILLLAPTIVALALLELEALLLGLFGHDLRRWAIERRGYFLAHVVAAPSEAEAMTRLLTLRPYLADRLLQAELGARA